MPKTIACVVGTRPEVLKMAPVIRRLRAFGTSIRVPVLSTGQHRELLDRALADFDLGLDDDLALMRPGQGLAELTSRSLQGLDGWLEQQRPDLVVAQGDTTSVFASALACHYRRVPFAHVEAGLRSGDLDAPFPEEANRILVARLADLHFAPTASAKVNLLREGIDPAHIHVVGNTVIDALRLIPRRSPPEWLGPADRLLLMTAHRRENQGSPLADACRAVRALARRDPELRVVFPVHPSPTVRAIVARELGGLDRVHLIEPVGYPEFVALMRASTVILTDSGGVQEEGPALGRPVLVLRESTERPEGVASGSCRLVGTDPARIIAAASPILSGAEAPPEPARLYGDGHAADRIAEILADRLGLPAREVQRWAEAA